MSYILTEQNIVAGESRQGRRMEYDTAKEGRAAFMDTMADVYERLDAPAIGLVGAETELILEAQDKTGHTGVLRGRVKRLVKAPGAVAHVWECEHGYEAPVEWKPGRD